MAHRKYIHVEKETGKLARSDIIALVTITVIYAVIAFFSLGDIHVPKSKYNFNTQKEVILDLGKEVSVSKIWSYTGCHDMSHYAVTYSNNLNEEWNMLSADEEELKYKEDNKEFFDYVKKEAEKQPDIIANDQAFNWNCVKMDVNTRYIRINSDVNDFLNEIVIIDSNGEKVEPVNYADYNELFDEQELFRGRKTALSGTYFDEIIYARTSYEMLHNMKWTEDSHPPLGKILISVGVAIFGMCPFGWRFMGTLFGILMVPVMYLLSKKLFKERWICIVTTILFSVDFMHFVQTRIALIDAFATLFIMISYYFMLNYCQTDYYSSPLKKTFIPLGICGVTMGLSWACKWTGVYASIGLCVLFIIQMVKRYLEYKEAKKRPNATKDGISNEYIIASYKTNLYKTLLFCFVMYIMVPAGIYTLSYIPFNDGSDSGVVERMINSQKRMYNYHTQINDTRTYSSKWYQWPVMYKPIHYYSGVVSDSEREGINAFGNPIIWWSGIVACIYMIVLIWKERDKRALFLLIGYMSQYIPWIFVGRMTFIYHYFTSIPFVVLMIVFSLYRLVQYKRKYMLYVYIFVGVAIGLFVLFYPVLVGQTINAKYADACLEWFDSWNLIYSW